MKVRQLYEPPMLPYHYIVELEDGTFKMFGMYGGFRKITEKDLMPIYYKPQKDYETVNEWLYGLYGLEKVQKKEGIWQRSMSI